MFKKKIGPRVDDEVYDSYVRIPAFKTSNAGVEYAMDMFPLLYRKTRLELKGIFLYNELKLIIKVVIKQNLDPRTAGQYLLTSVDTAIQVDNLHEKYSVDPDSLTGKVNKLTSFQKACLELWAWGWQKTDDIEGYVRNLSSD
ncbi:MAG: hypothetical protein U9N53_11570 [Bacteroidota bacterium]|nr:hypothetical protein [Bacteroidota bacterium]